MIQRKWLAEYRAWLDDPTSVQWVGSRGIWYRADINVDPIKRPDLVWRIKPRTVSINGREFEVPVDGNSGRWAIMVGPSEGGESRLFWHNTKEARDLHYKILTEESTPK